MRARFAHAADTVQEIASITKMMTALVAMDSLTDLDATATIDATDAQSGTALQTDDVLTLRDLLHTMLLPSDNGAAHALARIVGDMLPGEDAARTKFYAAMAAKADAIGMGECTFTDAWGDTSNVGTARGVAKLALAFAANSTLAAIGGTQSREITVTGANARTFTASHTATLSKFPGLICAKTGTSSGLYNLAVVWADAGRTFASVTLRAAAATNRDRDVLQMIGWQMERG